MAIQAEVHKGSYHPNHPAKPSFTGQLEGPYAHELPDTDTVLIEEKGVKPEGVSLVPTKGEVIWLLKSPDPVVAYILYDGTASLVPPKSRLSVANTVVVSWPSTA